jgi:DNA-binding response OmpR family regulator
MGTQRDITFLQRLARRLFTPSQHYMLIVDPDLSGAQRLASGLGRRHSVAVVGSAQEALHAIAMKAPSIVVTELDLPDASGLELLADVRGRSSTRNALLLAVMGRATVRDKIAVFQAGADDCLVKPVDPQMFAEHIERLSKFRRALELT